MKHRHSITCRRAPAVKTRQTKQRHKSRQHRSWTTRLVEEVPPAAPVHRRTATAHIARGLLLVLIVTAVTPAEDVARVETHSRGRHRRHLAQTFNRLSEQVEGSRRICGHAHSTSQHRHGVLEDIAMGVAHVPAQRLRPAVPRRRQSGRPDATRHCCPSMRRLGPSPNKATAA